MAAPRIEPLKSARLKKAILVLSQLDAHALGNALWQRLLGYHQYLDLPALARDEYPADLFVDCVAYCDQTHKELGGAIRDACGTLISEQSVQSSLNASALGELCYLAARIFAREAIDPLVFLAKTVSAELKTPDGDSIRSVALRALLALLGRFRGSLTDTEKYREVFEAHLTESGCQVVCLTGLAGLWPWDAGKYQALLQKKNYEVPDSDLNVALRAAGFDRLPVSSAV